MSEEEEMVKTGRAVRIALVALPLCLLLSTAGAVWYHWHKETEEVADPRLAMMGEGMDAGEVEDSLKKLEWLGEANWETEEGRKRMRGVLAFVEGTLSPQNYGFVVHTGAEVSLAGELWPMVWVDVAGGEKKEEMVTVAAAYDGDEGSLVALMTAARMLRESKLQRTVRFLLYPQRPVLDDPEVSRTRRGDFKKPGEEIVALLFLELMGQAVEGGGGQLSIVGPDLGGLETVMTSGDIGRVAIGERSEGDRNLIDSLAPVFGRQAAEVFQLVRPVGSKLKTPEVRGMDADALVGRTGVLVEVLRGLAEGE